MKKFVTLFTLTLVAILTFSSCDLNDDNYPTYNYELVAIDSVQIPEQFILGETKKIKVYYNRPSNCHFFDGFYYQANENTRIVGLQMAYTQNTNCEPLENQVQEASFDFYVSNNTTYTFKFFKGNDAEGQNTFLEYEIPVVEE